MAENNTQKTQWAEKWTKRNLANKNSVARKLGKKKLSGNKNWAKKKLFGKRYWAKYKFCGVPTQMGGCRFRRGQAVCQGGLQLLQQHHHHQLLHQQNA